MDPVLSHLLPLLGAQKINVNFIETKNRTRKRERIPSQFDVRRLDEEDGSKSTGTMKQSHGGFVDRSVGDDAAVVHEDLPSLPMPYLSSAASAT